MLRASSPLANSTTSSSAAQASSSLGPTPCHPPPLPDADCADPTVGNLNHEQLYSSDIIIAGTVTAVQLGSRVCSPGGSGVAMAVDAGAATHALLVNVSCVHKGAIACRANAEV